MTIDTIGAACLLFALAVFFAWSVAMAVAIVADALGWVYSIAAEEKRHADELATVPATVARMTGVYHLDMADEAVRRVIDRPRHSTPLADRRRALEGSTQ